MGCAEFEASPELKRLAKEKLGVKINNPHKHLDFVWGFICGFASTLFGIGIAFLIAWMILK